MKSRTTLQRAKSIGVIVLTTACVSFGAAAETYKFFVDGYPAENPHKTFATASTALEARQCVRFATIGTALNATEARGLQIVIR